MYLYKAYQVEVKVKRGDQVEVKVEVGTSPKHDVGHTQTVFDTHATGCGTFPLEFLWFLKCDKKLRFSSVCSEMGIYDLYVYEQLI